MQPATPFITDKYFQLITENEAKFIFEHTEKQLKDTLDTNTLIVTRLTSLITVTSTLLVALFGYAINRYETHNIHDKLLITSICGVIYLFIVSILIFQNIKPNVYYSIGSEPIDLINENIFNDRNEKYRMISIYVNEIHEYQKRLWVNKQINDARWGLYKRALILLVITPAVLAIIYALLPILR